MNAKSLSRIPPLRALRQLGDQVSIYLPVILMGVLALGSYWILRNAPHAAAPHAPQPARHVPDYVMRDFTVRTFDAQGQFKNQMLGIEGRHYPDDDTLEVDQARILAIGQSGHHITARSDKLTSNADQTEHLLEGNVVAVREAAPGPAAAVPRIEYRGQQIRVFTEQERLESSLPVEMLRDTDRITADSLEYNERTQTGKLQGRVRATLQPRR